MDPKDNSLLRFSPLEEWLGQLVFAQAFGRFRSIESENYKDLEKLVAQARIGGLKIYHGYALGTAMLLRHLGQISPLPLLVAADLEQGLGQQISDTPRFPAISALGMADDEELAYQAGQTIGKQALLLGINMPFMPLLDVPSTQEQYFGVRCLGSDAKQVTKIGTALIKGLQASGVFTVAKYFPGHGRQRFLPDGCTLIEVDKEIIERDAQPFNQALKLGIDAIMVGPGAFPALDASTWISDAQSPPAMLSKPICTGMLRHQMGFQGLIVSDALNLPFLRARYSQRELAAQAIRAGCDILVALSHPKDALDSIDGIRDALDRGWVTEEQLQKSISKIAALKARTVSHQPIGSRALEDSPNAPGTDAELKLIEKIANASVKLIRGIPPHLSPITKPVSLPFIVIGGYSTVENLRADHWQPWHHTPLNSAISFSVHVLDHYSDELLKQVVDSANWGWVVMVLLENTPTFSKLLRQTASLLMQSHIGVALILPVSQAQMQELSDCGDLVVWCADFYQPSRTAALNILIHNLLLKESGS